MASNSTFDKVLLSEGKGAACAYIHADCSQTTNPKHLNEVLDNFLNPAKAIDEWETTDWCKWLMAGGRTPEEFANTVCTYDNATTCGLVFMPNFVAYHCRTCGISPSMLLCTECFKKGNHQQHDFNMFVSHPVGTCNCGDTSMMKETGFCDRHGPNKSKNKSSVPTNLMCVAKAMMPRIILRLIQHLRENSQGSSPDAFITMLLDFNNMGSLMRSVMTGALTNPQMYRVLNELPQNLKSEYARYMMKSKTIYEDALKSLPNPAPMAEYPDCPSLQEHLTHRTFLDELVFWTVKFEFPQKVVYLLLNMLPDPDYKEALTKAFVLHYTRISMMLERSSDPSTLIRRVVHVSVQLFSNESLALRMTEQLNLLHVMVVSLQYMMRKILIQNTLHDPDKNYVVDCGSSVMEERCYWPLVSDLINVLSHRSVALKFMADDSLLKMWFTFLSMFQGMNVNQRELSQYVEFEPNSYFPAFSAELEASAFPMWALVSHLADESTVSLTERALPVCLSSLLKWLDTINFKIPNVNDSVQVSFHLPLHRYLAVFLCQAVAKQGLTLNKILPNANTLQLLMMHPLKVQVVFYEILNGLWVRNGSQIIRQAMNYIQCTYCNSMVDADLYLLQICSTRIRADSFLNVVIDKFHIKEWMSLTPDHPPQNAYLYGEDDTPMLESFLTFLATLVSVRTNLGLSETALNRLEMITLLCMGDKTHSQLIELMPERCATSQSRDFESLLTEVADYKAAFLETTGNMQQGMYVPKAGVWEKQYDPIHVLLRAVHRRDIETSMDRYTEYCRHANKLRAGTSPWPPFRVPADCGEAYRDPRKILQSRVFHAVALVVLYKAVRGHVSKHVMALVIFLLEMAVITCGNNTDDESSKMCATNTQPPRILNDMDLASWFISDSLTENLRGVINKVMLTPEPEVSPLTYSLDSEIEWEESEADNEISDLSTEGPNNALMLEEAERAPQPEAMVLVPHLRKRDPPTVKVNESIISLLLKLHSKLSDVPDSYNLEESQASYNSDGESIFGDGPFFIGKLLLKIAALDTGCKDFINETRKKLWPPQPECEEEQKKRDNKEGKERRRRAKEQKLMAEFASNQKQFMERKEKDEGTNDMDEANEEVLLSKQEYDCVICNQSTPSTEDKPMGLVVLVQATSVVGHSRRQGYGERVVLPTCDEEKEIFRKDDTLASEFDKRVEEMHRHFDLQSWLLSINLGWEGGVHVQTCGHHIHLDCLKTYLQSLTERQLSLPPGKGEYLCPLCQQLANSVLPLSPQLGECAQIVTSCPANMTDILHELNDFLEENRRAPSTSSLSEAMGKAMEDMTSSTQLKPIFKPKSDEPSCETFLFVTSIARTNLEVKLVQRGGSLVSITNEPPNPLLPKRDCIVPLLHVLAVRARVLALWPVCVTFQQLCGLTASPPGASALAAVEVEVPLLVRDPIALLLQFVLLLPLHLDQTYFTTVVKMMYNLLYYQVVAQVSCGLTGAERLKVCQGIKTDKVNSLSSALALINESLGNTDLYMEDDGASCNQTIQLNMVELEQQVQKLCLPFLRISSLLRHHIYNEPLPKIQVPRNEFVRLVYYLELVTEGMDLDCFNAAVALNWPSDVNMTVTSLQTWCVQLAVFVSKSQFAARSFLVDQHITWHPPKLLELPREYEKIFTYYRERPCSQCHSVPKETTICLLCGTIVCLNQNCCRQQDVGEAVAHSQECGAGTGIFLNVTSTYIHVIRGQRNCQWGSLYLDDFEEEDCYQTRGKPLYLNRERYQFLEQQWLAHRFDHMKKKWVLHNGVL